MKLCILVALALTVSAPACFAKQAPPKPPAAKASANGHKVASGIGLDGQDTGLRCSTENPNIEYRDCVNASTRDSNAKVRLG